jgi:hypothetical protein
MRENNGWTPKSFRDRLRMFIDDGVVVLTQKLMAEEIRAP